MARIWAGGLKLHPDKCHFMQREVWFLGQRGWEGINTPSKKLQAVADWPTPVNQQKFLGLSLVLPEICSRFCLYSLLLCLNSCRKTGTSYGRNSGRKPFAACSVPWLRPQCWRQQTLPWPLYWIQMQVEEGSEVCCPRLSPKENKWSLTAFHV